jgi:hypothetical protein
VANPAAKHEPAPLPERAELPHVADMVHNDIGLFLGGGAICRDVMARKAEGMKKYGTPLQPFNGRSAIMDLYQELLDAANYMRQHIYENSNGDRWGLPNEMLTKYRSLLELIQFIHVRLPENDQKW